MKELKLYIHDLMVRVLEQRTRESSSQSHAFNNGAMKALEKVHKFIDANYPEGDEVMQTQRVLAMTIERQLTKLKRLIAYHATEETEKEYLESWVDDIIDSAKLLIEMIESNDGAEMEEKGKKASRKLNIGEMP